MKYLIVKGYLGFGDRLESLKMCVKYALEKNRAIYIDWRDSVWSHSDESFYKYFDLKMPSIDIDCLPPNLSVYPECWKSILKEPYKDEYATLPDINIGSLTKDYEEDIVVYSCIGYRIIFPSSKYFTDIFRVIHPEIKQEVLKRVSTYDLKNKICIHLRGTDRLQNLSKLQRFRGVRLRMIEKGLFKGEGFIALTDDEDFARMWNANFKYPLLTKIFVSNSIGNHLVKKENLAVTKDTLNKDMLIDFFTMAFCKDILSSSKDSRFASESRRLHPWITDIFSD
jgi:hypothetical protein